MVGFHRPVYTSRRRKSPRGRRLGAAREIGGEGGMGGGGGQASFDFIVSEGKNRP